MYTAGNVAIVARNPGVLAPQEIELATFVIFIVARATFIVAIATSKIQLWHAENVGTSSF